MRTFQEDKPWIALSRSLSLALCLSLSLYDKTVDTSGKNVVNEYNSERERERESERER